MTMQVGMGAWKELHWHSYLVKKKKNWTQILSRYFTRSIILYIIGSIEMKYSAQHVFST